MSAGKQLSGFTLLELLVTIAVLAIVATVGIPGFQQLIINSRLAAQNNELIAMLHFTKSEAIRRNATVTAQLTSGGLSWTGEVRPPTGADPAAGCVAGVIRCAANTGVSLSPTPTTVGFDNRGYLAPVGGVWGPQQLCLRNENGTRSRLIEISPTGQITSETAACGG
jgi:prepilin-type N-terminal cleavage/methylation domain-containing protein